MYEKFLKRLIDIVISILFLPILLIMFIIIGTIIKLEDGGKIFYNAKRIGKNSKLFYMYKFRSMKEDSAVLLNEDGSTYNSENDIRVTKIGKFLRETSLDEFPQFLNVLKGDMSIVGPRASLSSVLNTFEMDEKDKMKVRPGITGYTQAFYRNSISTREKRLLDAYYANNVSFKMDVRIFLKTINTVFRRDGIYSENNKKE